MYKAIAYVSQVSENISEEEIDKILEKSEEYNKNNDVTGILLFSEGNFLQVIEGKKEIVDPLFDKIKADYRHQGLIIIFNRPIQRAELNGYKADFITQHKRINDENVSTYLKHIQTLDPKSQAVVKNLLKNFLK